MCSGSTSFFLTEFWTAFARVAKLMVLMVSSKLFEAGVTAQMISVEELPPRAEERILCNNRELRTSLSKTEYNLVSLLSRKGMCRLLLPSLNRRMHLPNVSSDLLMWPSQRCDQQTWRETIMRDLIPPSFRRNPVDPVLETRSLPARSTRFNDAIWTPPST